MKLNQHSKQGGQMNNQLEELLKELDDIFRYDDENFDHDKLNNLFVKAYELGQKYSTSGKLNYQNGYKAGQKDTLKWVEEEVIQADEKKIEKLGYYNDNLVISLRNKLRAEQRQKLKELKKTY